MFLRKVFNLDQPSESTMIDFKKSKDGSILFVNPVSAAGCLFYKLETGSETGKSRVCVLLIQYKDPNWPRLDDFGGQIDVDDTSIENALVREVKEESNGLINFTTLDKSKRLNFYNRQSKYYQSLIEVDGSFFPDTTVFGEIEEVDSIARVVQWHQYDTVKSQLAYRMLNNTKLIEYLDGLNN